MANLKNLDVFCNKHLLPMRMFFAGWAGAYRPRYKCPLCRSTKVFQRNQYGGRIRRVG